MENDFEDSKKYTVTTPELCDAIGVTPACIFVYAKKGAFPHARTDAELRPAYYFHEKCLTLTGGELKKNMAENKYSEPFFIFEKEKKKRAGKGSSELKSINNKLDLLISLVKNL